jgi:hypothetical protein
MVNYVTDNVETCGESAGIRTEEFGDDVKVLNVTVSEGVEILAISFPKINAALKDKVVEVGLDATCKFHSYAPQLIL